MTALNAGSLLPLEMTRHLHRPPHGLLPPLQPGRSPPPPNFGLCTMAAGGGGSGVARTSPPTVRPRPASTSLMALGSEKASVGGGSAGSSGGSFLNFHGGPTAASSADNNTCRLIDYRNAQVAAFHVDGRELICLPQAFELFLKHLVGGLHTVYTKLKRLDITPVVCNVEQVRILRGLGAIQPGVNRCKLISPREFDILYEDCTNSSARPGRPPKRTSSLTSTEVALEQFKRSKFTNFTDFYTQNRLIVDAKKALGGFGAGTGGPPGGTGYMPYLDFKKSPLFSGCYNYPPQVAPHLPFIPFGYHGMMNLAVAGSHLAALQRRGDDLQRFATSAVRPHPANSTTPSQRSDEQEAAVKVDNSDASEDATEIRHRHHLDNYLGVDSDKPLNLETHKTNVRTPPQSPLNDRGHSSPAHTAPPVGLRDEMTTMPSHELHQQRGNKLEPSDVVITYAASDGVRSQSSAEMDDDDDDDDGGGSCYSSVDNQSLNSAAGNSGGHCRADEAQIGLASPQPLDPQQANVAAALISDQYSVETLLANVQALLKLAIDSARHREQQANIKAALLQKQLKREKKTRRQLQRRLTTFGASNHGDGDNSSHGRGMIARSPNVDDQLRRVSNLNEAPTSALQTTALQTSSEMANEITLQNGFRYSTTALSTDNFN